MIPVYAFVEGDTIGLLLLADETASADAFAELAQRSSSVRCAPRPGARVRLADRWLDPRASLADAGVTALDRLDVAFPDPT